MRFGSARRFRFHMAHHQRDVGLGVPVRIETELNPRLCVHSPRLAVSSPRLCGDADNLAHPTGFEPVTFGIGIGR